MASKSWVVAFCVGVIVAVALFAWAVKEAWSAEIVLGVSALYVSVGGFAIAIAEIRHAATVTTATERAVQHTLKVVAAGHLTVSIVQLRHAVDDLERATDDKDPVGARRAINTWRNLAAEARGPLCKQFPHDDAVIFGPRSFPGIGSARQRKALRSGRRSSKANYWRVPRSYGTSREPAGSLDR